ncbi:MAG TPA: DUF1206 domain-containing protein [Acidimicrobiales bacterium]|nr:DUF1206 domain-containing protein [Acidimicrobiales bacterium]
MGAARLGLTARAAVYLLIGFLAVALATGHSTKETDQWGAFQQLNGGSAGHVLVLVVAVGLAAYALWRFTEAAFGVAVEGRGAAARLKSLFRGCVYAFFALNAFQVAFGGRSASQAQRQQTIAAKVMHHSAGRWAIAAVGAIVVLVGLMLVFEGLRRKFRKFLNTWEMPPLVRRAVTVLGTVGTTARGAVFALAGVLVVEAAVQYNPAKAAGIDGALRSLRDAPAGPWLLGAAAAGLVTFGLYGLAEARWRRV